MAEIKPAVAVARDHDDGVTEGELIGNIMAAHHQVELAVAGDVGRGWRIEEADPARGGHHGKYRRVESAVTFPWPEDDPGSQRSGRIVARIGQIELAVAVKVAHRHP